MNGNRLMSMLFAVAAAVSMAMGTAQAQESKTLGIVALLANDALNIDVIGGATKAAEAAG